MRSNPLLVRTFAFLTLVFALVPACATAAASDARDAGHPPVRRLHQGDHHDQAAARGVPQNDEQNQQNG